MQGFKLSTFNTGFVPGINYQAIADIEKEQGYNLCIGE
jgi:hypothetical protein